MISNSGGGGDDDGKAVLDFFVHADHHEVWCRGPTCPNSSIALHMLRGTNPTNIQHKIHFIYVCIYTYKEKEGSRDLPFCLPLFLFLINISNLKRIKHHNYLLTL